jgi:tRNA dimethylallyltransferase
MRKTRVGNGVELLTFLGYCHHMEKSTVYVICGPTATGKSDYAVDLALRVRGEIISADSRQVYRGMDLGTGKITHEEMKGVPHHLIDIKDPNEDFSVEEFQKLCFEKIEEILSRGNVPILCGGTGFYIQAITDNIVFQDIPKNETLRHELEEKTLEELQEILLQIPKEDGASVDTENKRRVIRAIEIGKHVGMIPNIKRAESKYRFEFTYLDFEDNVLKDRIEKRLEKRFELGMIDEVRKLHDSGVSWKRLEDFGLEYKYIALFLQEIISKSEMKETLKTKIWQYAKRQRTWFKKYLKT